MFGIVLRYENEGKSVKLQLMSLADEDEFTLTFCVSAVVWMRTSFSRFTLRCVCVLVYVCV